MTRPTKRLDNDERRSQLLAVGLELFSNTAFDSVSIEEIARRVDISRGLLYHYFRSKRDFYVAIVQLAADDLLSRLGQGDAATPGERLRTDLHAYLDFVTQRSAGFITLQRGGIGSDPQVTEVLERTRSAIVGHVLAGMGVQHASVPLEVALFGWVGYVESASLRWLTAPADTAPPNADLVAVFSQVLATTVSATGATAR